MDFVKPVRLLLGVGLVLASAIAAPAAVVASRGSVDVQIIENRFGVAGPPQRQTIAFPSDANSLPIQAVVRTASTDGDAAGVSAAQFSDPATSAALEDTDEFALQMALASTNKDIGYLSFARAEEVRSVSFSSGELGGAANGSSAALSGVVFIDGALAIFASNELADLSGTVIAVRVTVDQERQGAQPLRVFDAELRMVGGPGLEITQQRTGAFPALGVFESDLTLVDESLSTFRAVVFPNLRIEYPFTAVVGETFDLRATVQVDASSIGGGAGVAAVIGTPIDALLEVVGQTQGEEPAAKMTAALEAERAEPTGAPAFSDPVLSPFLGACGPLGLESALLMTLLAGARAGGVPLVRRR